MQLHRFSSGRRRQGRLCLDSRLISAQGLGRTSSGPRRHLRAGHPLPADPRAGRVFPSHAGVWERFAARGDLDQPWLFEDDVSLPRDLGRQVVESRRCRPTTTWCSSASVCTRCDAAPAGRFYRARQFHLLHAMIIPPEGPAGLAAERLFLIDQQVDAALSEVTDELVVYTAGPEPLVHQDNGFQTDIQIAMPETASQARTRREHLGV